MLRPGWFPDSRAAAARLAALAAWVCLAGGAAGCGDAAVTPREAGASDTNDDGPVPCTSPPRDSDGDTIADVDEGSLIQLDWDGDGIPDFRDDDSDGDGIPDVAEAGDGNLCTPGGDSDKDGIPNFRDDDSDGNALPDAEEGSADADGDGVLDAHDLDNDDDTIGDVSELGPTGRPIDTDGDGTPDHLDLDSDADHIPDSAERSTDRDGDKLPNQRDLDSDGDCTPDTIEAGPDPSRPLNTDGDGYPDFLDYDSDDDGLPDLQEDTNCNGARDPTESDPKEPDTDRDGYPDVVERAAGTDPADPKSKLDPDDFYFVLPYTALPQSAPLDFETDIVRADLLFQVDVTGSMINVARKLQETLITRIAPGAAQTVPNLALCVSSFEDFPVPHWGDNMCPVRPSLPFRLHQRCSVSVQKAADGIDQYDKPLGCGGDAPESGYEALYQAATGEGVAWPGGSIPKFDPMAGFDAAFDMGSVGGVGFRVGALPIIVHATDVESYHGPDYDPAIPMAHTKEQTLAALNAIGARVVGVAVGTRPKKHLIEVAEATGAVVRPLDAFPSGRGMCLTGVSGAPQAANPATGLCPLVFEIGGDGTGLAGAIVDAIAAVAQHATVDIAALALADPAKLPNVDTSRFIKSLTPVPPPPPGATIRDDQIIRVKPGSPVRFVVKAQNDFLVPTINPQLFEVTVQILGDLVALLDERKVYVIVPPVQGPT